MHVSVIAQIIGFVAVAINLLVFQVNKRRTMLNIGATAAVIYTLHFYLLGAYTGSAMNAIGGVRDVVTARITPNRRNVWVLVLLGLVAAGATYLTWRGILSLLPLAGTLLNGISFWNKNPKIIRRLYLIVPPIWFVYNAIVGSYPGMLIEIIMLTSNLVGQYRFDRNLKRSSVTN